MFEQSTVRMKKISNSLQITIVLTIECSNFKCMHIFFICIHIRTVDCQNNRPIRTKNSPKLPQILFEWVYCSNDQLFEKSLSFGHITYKFTSKYVYNIIYILKYTYLQLICLNYQFFEQLKLEQLIGNHFLYSTIYISTIYCIQYPIYSYIISILVYWQLKISIYQYFQEDDYCSCTYLYVHKMQKLIYDQYYVAGWMIRYSDRYKNRSVDLYGRNSIFF
eukprot:TRINITY_DN3578_c0_g1_i4.p2 TRINITY_DN3578_c0_g1~~TRINITY_DN3578_c0_g1_i4.p2  ORF type:complete len:220 (+),score=-34.34 TRINITY_DN3578_c0_g1_i4:101-760(+)